MDKWRIYSDLRAENYLKYFKGCKKVLDLGSEKGQLVRFLRERGINAVGLDLLYKDEYTIKGDARKMPFKDNTFDCISMFHFIEHLTPPDLVKITSEIYRVLKNDGKLLIATPAMRIWNDASHIRPYPFAAIKQLMYCPDYLGGKWKFEIIKHKYKIRYNAYARGLFYRLHLLTFYKKYIYPILNFLRLGFVETVVIARKKPMEPKRV